MNISQDDTYKVDNILNDYQFQNEYRRYRNSIITRYIYLWIACISAWAILYFSHHHGDIIILWILIPVIVYFLLFSVYSPKFDKDLLESYIQKILHLLNPRYVFDKDWIYSFDDNHFLRNKNFIHRLDIIEYVRNSCMLDTYEEQWWFLLKSFELKSSTISGSWKSRSRKTYRMQLSRIQFKNYRIPAGADIYIKPRRNFRKISLPSVFHFFYLILFFAYLGYYAYSQSDTEIFIVLWTVFGIIIWFFLLIYWLGYYFRERARVKFSSESFERLYNVYSENGEYTQSILNDEVIHLLTKFQNQSGEIYSYLIHEDSVYIKRDVTKRSFFHIHDIHMLYKSIQELWELQAIFEKAFINYPTHNETWNELLVDVPLSNPRTQWWYEIFSLLWLSKQSK